MKRMFVRALCMPFLIAAVLTACGGGGDDANGVAAPAPGPGLQSLQIVDRGSVISTRSSTTDLAPGRIQYYAETFDKPVQFSAVLSAEDFARLATLVDSKDLTRTLGQTSNLHASCRHYGYNITIEKNNIIHKFSIEGSQTCGAGAPPGLSELNALVGELLQKHYPASAT